MRENSNTLSHSAPKICRVNEKTAIYRPQSTISTDVSPSLYAISNHPLDSSDKACEQSFFDASLSLSDLQLLGRLCNVNIFDSPEPIEKLRKTKSCSSAIDNFDNSLEKLRIGIKFIFPSSHIIDECEDEATPQLVDCPDHRDLFLPVVKLLPAPKANKKRVLRCTYENQEISEKKCQGVLKNYNLRKRFGFIKYEEEKIFICEDDIVLSGVNLSLFKDNVAKKKTINVTFQISSQVENSKETRKAVNIEMA